MTLNINIQLEASPISDGEFIITNLDQIMNEHNISRLVVPYYVMHLISTQQYPQRNLLDAASKNNTASSNNFESAVLATNQNEDNFLCHPWPIYLGFFAGIFVTVIITLAIQCTTGETDNELNNALAKVINSAGMYITNVH